jgi:hypothetical protein
MTRDEVLAYRRKVKQYDKGLAEVKQALDNNDVDAAIQKNSEIMSAGLPSIAYDQDYIEAIIPDVVKLVQKFQRRQKPYLSDKYRQFSFLPDFEKYKYKDKSVEFDTKINTNTNGIFVPNARQIEIYPESVQDRLLEYDELSPETLAQGLLNIWLHEGQHSKDFSNNTSKQWNDLFKPMSEDNEDNIKLSPYESYISKPGEVRAAGRVIGTNMRKDDRPEPRDIDYILDYVLDKFPDNSHEARTVEKIRELYKTSGWHGNLYNVLLDMVKQSMAEGTLKGVYSDQRVKDVISGVVRPSKHIINAIRTRF